eukprot:2923783-Rhodomonas_salina.4
MRLLYGLVMWRCWFLASYHWGVLSHTLTGDVVGDKIEGCENWCQAKKLNRAVIQTGCHTRCQPLRRYQPSHSTLVALYAMSVPDTWQRTLRQKGQLRVTVHFKLLPGSSIQYVRTENRIARVGVAATVEHTPRQHRTRT